MNRYFKVATQEMFVKVNVLHYLPAMMLCTCSSGFTCNTSLNRYFKVLTQEMSVKVDQGFLNAVLTLFATDEVDEETQRQLLKTDMAVVDRPLMDYAVQSTADEQKHFYDMLHVSPLKVWSLVSYD